MPRISIRLSRSRSRRHRHRSKKYVHSIPVEWEDLNSSQKRKIGKIIREKYNKKHVRTWNELTPEERKMQYRLGLGLGLGIPAIVLATVLGSVYLAGDR